MHCRGWLHTFSRGKRAQIFQVGKKTIFGQKSGDFYAGALIHGTVMGEGGNIFSSLMQVQINVFFKVQGGVNLVVFKTVSIKYIKSYFFLDLRGRAKI